jgi:hypothetical protein
MSRMTWNAPERRFFETGLDRGVLYPKKTPPPGPLVYTNLVPNPSFEVDKTGWNNYSAGDVAATSQTVEASESSPFGDSQLRITGNIGSGPSARIGIRSDPIPVQPETLYTAAATFGESLPAGKDRVIWVEVLDATETIIEGSSGGGALPGRYSESVYTHFDAAYIRVYCWISGGTSVTSDAVSATIDGVMLVEGGVSVPYFDGNTEDGPEFSYEWVGAANNSASRQRESTSLATPWDGLVSVEESGGEAARAYYADGRPFLFLPIPKEYKATLNAYTYPDAFSEIMGLAEVTDGMYLDSQPSAAFDLSYRTLVGNGLDGSEHGYKIHLVYNATVTPGALSYETLSDSINPSTMSWEIQAVPVRVEGFRPTAHIVIDTRHMDQNKIDAIEELLYGSDTTLPRMPDPQLIFDTLHYGDMIVVIDNGDGTFDVEGSYENVYLIEDGQFRLENIDGSDNGDGTFTISSTEG